MQPWGLLQESHDGYTRVSLAIKKLGIQIINQGLGGNIKALQGRPVGILKAMVPMSENIEGALFETPRGDLTEKVVMNIVNKAVTPYANAWQFYRELIALFEAAGGMQKMPTADIKKLKSSLKEDGDTRSLCGEHMEG